MIINLTSIMFYYHSMGLVFIKLLGVGKLFNNLTVDLNVT